MNTNVRFCLSYDIHITLKFHFDIKKLKLRHYLQKGCYGRHNVSRKSINYLWFINLIPWRCFTPRLNVI